VVNNHDKVTHSVGGAWSRANLILNYLKTHKGVAARALCSKIEAQKKFNPCILLFADCTALRTKKQQNKRPARAAASIYSPKKTGSAGQDSTDAARESLKKKCALFRFTTHK